jgi:hypothetical protein
VDHAHPAGRDRVYPEEFLLYQPGYRQHHPHVWPIQSLSLHPCHGPVEEGQPLFSRLPDPSLVGDAVHGQKVHLKYPVVAVDQVKPAPPDLPLCKTGKADLSHKPRKAEHRDLMKRDRRLSPANLVGEEMYLEPPPHGQPLRQLVRKALGPSHQTVFRDDHGNFHARRSVRRRHETFQE